MTDWLEILRAECTATTQAATARRLGVSPTVVNQVLKGNYKGNLNNIRARVEGELLGAVVDCPALGELPRQRCVEYQARSFAATNPMRVLLYHTCRTCPNQRKG